MGTRNVNIVAYLTHPVLWLKDPCSKFSKVGILHVRPVEGHFWSLRSPKKKKFFSQLVGLSLAGQILQICKNAKFDEKQVPSNHIRFSEYRFERKKLI